MARKRVGVLISGSGSNLQALIDAAADPAYPAEIVLVVSNKPEAFGLQRAEKAGIPVKVFDHKAYSDRAQFDAAMDTALREAGCEIVCLAGFMRILSTGFVEAWAGRMLNIHPSLLPSFKGLHPQQQALDAGVKVAGCTVHLVTPDLDDGPILEQATVPVLDSDDVATLSARILEQEHRIYPKGLALVASGSLRIEGRRAFTGGA